MMRVEFQVGRPAGIFSSPGIAYTGPREIQERFSANVHKIRPRNLCNRESASARHFPKPNPGNHLPVCEPGPAYKGISAIDDLNVFGWVEIAKATPTHHFRNLKAKCRNKDGGCVQMTKECLRKYLNMFLQIYPKHPPLETLEVYERVLSDIDDLGGGAACEICLRECKFFPMPAEIRERVAKPDNFISTMPHYEDNPPTPEAKAEFDYEMRKVARKLGISNVAKTL